MTKLQKLLKGDLNAYKSIPFWSWNDKLNPQMLRRQIRAMKKAGMGGFFMHARGGLQTEYLGKDWMEAVESCIDEAKKLGMDAWCYDENGWPSGFAGMKLLEDPENLVHYIVCEHKKAHDPAALAVYIIEGEDIRRVSEDVGDHDYICVYDRVNTSNVDVLNPKVVRKFLDETHEKYYAQFGEHFGKTMLGFFTDEPQYFRYDTAYTPVLLEAFATEYGEDVLDYLGALFVDCRQAKQFRFRYWRLMNKLFIESYAKQVFDWCEEHNCMLTGHAIEEEHLFTQMWCCAGVMPFYEYQHIPGIDWLGRKLADELSSRQVSSVAMQLGKKHIITETFALTGWDVTPRELKQIAENQYVHGVNSMCHHLYAYSIRGQRKRDYPAFFSEHNPWCRDFESFNNYFTTLGYMLAESTEVVDVALIHPMHSAYLTYNRRKDRKSIEKLENDFHVLIERLGAAGVGHHYIDELLLEKHGRVAEDKLIVGKCAYSVVLIPEMDGLDASTAALLAEFVARGGKICLAGKRPTLVDGAAADLSFLTSEISIDALETPGCTIDKKNTGIRSTFRKAPFGDFLYAVNLSKEESYTVSYRVEAPGAMVFDLEKHEYRPLYFEQQGGTTVLPLTLAPGESKVIVFTEAKPAKRAPKMHKALSLDTNASVISFGENALNLDYAAISYDNVHFEAPLPIPAISDRLLRERQNRTVYLKYGFHVKDIPERIFLEAEYKSSPHIWLNGHEIELDREGLLDPHFVRADISKRLCHGENDVVFQIEYYQAPIVGHVLFDEPEGTESIRNCLSFDTDIESIYLMGDFGVFSGSGFYEGAKNTSLAKGDFIIEKAPQRIDMAKTNQQGFPFFAGKMVLEKTFTVDKTDYALHLKGRYALCDVHLNGVFVSRLMFENTCSLKGHLAEGENKLRLHFISGNRNLLGPHHVAADPAASARGSLTPLAPGQKGKAPVMPIDMPLCPSERTALSCGKRTKVKINHESKKTIII